MLKKDNQIIKEDAVLNFYKYSKANYSKKAGNVIITDASNKAFEFFIYWVYNNNNYSLNFKTSLYLEKLQYLKENEPIIINEYIDNGNIIYIKQGLVKFLNNEDIKVILTKYNNEFKINLQFNKENLEFEKIFKI